MRKDQIEGRDLHEKVNFFSLTEVDHEKGEGWLKEGDIEWLCIRVVGNSINPRTGTFRRSWFRSSEYRTA